VFGSFKIIIDLLKAFEEINTAFEKNLPKNFTFTTKRRKTQAEKIRNGFIQFIQNSVKAVESMKNHNVHSLLSDLSKTLKEKVVDQKKKQRLENEL